MGQRSQIYIRITDNYNEYPKLYAKYFQWNYGERMISRARHGIEYIKESMEYISHDSVQEKINRIFDINFDMKDIAFTSDLIKEWLEDFREHYTQVEYIFTSTANNDGKLFIDVNANGEIKVAFTDYNLNLLSPEAYMDWDFEKWQNSEYLSPEAREICKNNIEYINKNVSFMTKEELQEFINYDYSKQIEKLAEELGIKLEKSQSEIQQETEQTLEEVDICE